MKLNKLLLTAAVTTTLLGLGVGCGGKTVTIWVGKESAGFYQDVVSRWIVNNSEKYGGYKVNVVAADTGAAAGVMMAALIWSLIIPAIESSSVVPVVIGLILGVGIFYLIDLFINN